MGLDGSWSLNPDPTVQKLCFIKAIVFSPCSYSVLVLQEHL